MTLWLLPEVLPGTCVPIGDPKIPAGDTAENCVRSVIDTRFQVYSGQACAASLAKTVGTTTPEFLLRRVYYTFSMSWAQSADVNCDRFKLNHLIWNYCYCIIWCSCINNKGCFNIDIIFDRIIVIVMQLYFRHCTIIVSSLLPYYLCRQIIYLTLATKFT